MINIKNNDYCIQINDNEVIGVYKDEKSDKMYINNSNLEEILKKSMLAQLNDLENYKDIIIREKGIVFIINPNCIRLIARGQGYKKIYNKRYHIILNNKLRENIINQIEKEEIK